MKKIKTILKKLKGFTLIELLAVIVILAIILLIAMPIVLNVINEARKGAFEATSRGLIKTAENEYMKNALSGNTNATTYEFENFVLKEGTLEFSGKGPKNGCLHVTSDGRVVIVVEDGTWLVKKEANEKNINVEKLEEKNIEEMCTDMIARSVIGLPENENIKYVYDNDNIGLNVTPCEINEVDFTHITDKRDDKTYAVTKIGNQCWMAENLAYTGNGCLEESWDPYHEITNPYPRACATHGPNEGLNQGSYMNGIVEEVLYQWGAAMNGATTEKAQGLCPEGWYIPTHDEWTTLEREVCTSATCESDYPYDAVTGGWRGTDEGEKLKAAAPNWDGINTVGFNVLPAGERSISGVLNNVGASGHWWSSSSSSSDSFAWRRDLYSFFSGVPRFHERQAFGDSVRCLQAL